MNEWMNEWNEVTFADTWLKLQGCKSFPNKFCDFINLLHWSVAGIVWTVYWLGYRLDGLGFKFREEQGNFLFAKTSSPSFRSTHPPIELVPEFFPRDKVAGAWYSLHGLHRYNLTFTDHHWPRYSMNLNENILLWSQCILRILRNIKL